MSVTFFLGYNYNMTCRQSVSTKSGKFTFFTEVVTRCQAEKKCKKRGEILAPVTNCKDAKKIQELFESNVGIEGCKFRWQYYTNYWLGLDVNYTENTNEYTFSNGVKWKKRKHEKIYQNGINNYTECGFALFQPIFREAPFKIGPESPACGWERKYSYACFKPTDATAEPIVGDAENYKSANIPFNTDFSIGLIAGVFAGVMVGVGLLKRKHAKEREEFNEWRKAKKSGMENSSVYDIAVGENQ